MDSTVRSSERSEIYRYECHWSHASRASPLRSLYSSLHHYPPAPSSSSSSSSSPSSPPPPPPPSPHSPNLPFYPFLAILFHPFPSFSIPSFGAATTEKNDEAFHRLSAPWHLLHDFEVSKCRSSGPCHSATRIPSPRNVPLISLSTNSLSLLSPLVFRSLRLPPFETFLRHSMRIRTSKIDQINDRIKPNIQKRMAACRRETLLPGHRSTTL